jgi:hypothetical protein
VLVAGSEHLPLYARSQHHDPAHGKHCPAPLRPAPRQAAFTCWSTASGARQHNWGSRIDLILAGGPAPPLTMLPLQRLAGPAPAPDLAPALVPAQAPVGVPFSGRLVHKEGRGGGATLSVSVTGAFVAAWLALAVGGGFRPCMQLYLPQPSTIVLGGDCALCWKHATLACIVMLSLFSIGPEVGRCGWCDTACAKVH